MATPVSEQTPSSIIIIGAGVAGVKLAHTCLRVNRNMRVTVLEANDYVGGRMKSFSFEGHTVEMGANWISGRTEKYVNPIWRLAMDASLRGHDTGRDEASSVRAFDSQGRDVTEEYLEAKKSFDDVYEEAVQSCSSKGITQQNDVDVRSLLEESGWKKEDEMNAIEKTAEYNALEVWVADGLDRLSAAHDMQEGANDVDLGKDEFFVEDQRGFNFVLKDMVLDIERWGGRIILGSEVQRVQYLPDDVKVVCRDVNTGEINQYEANAIVSTVSLGVLQSGSIKFVPPFPGWKKTALNEIGMFTFSKLFVKFEEQFWPDTEHIVICGEEKGRYPLWMKYRNTDQHIFMCYLGGSEAERVESLTNEEVKDEVEELFKSVFSTSRQKVDTPFKFRPSSVAITDWSRNPRFLGSFSYFPVHSFAKVSDLDLTEGLTGTEERTGQKTLFFAGECFDDLYNGWVQGAYRSGERVANSIMGATGK